MGAPAWALWLACGQCCQPGKSMVVILAARQGYCNHGAYGLMKISRAISQVGLTMLKLSLD